ncbi:MAG: VWA domain-containing protein [Candidatus Heimdallarchaeota archaeon]|nr:VWA domain-containing protein [Candidatus Heimdallarchaeota archaeon]
MVEEKDPEKHEQTEEKDDELVVPEVPKIPEVPGVTSSEKVEKKEVIPEAITPQKEEAEEEQIEKDKSEEEIESESTEEEAVDRKETEKRGKLEEIEEEPLSLESEGLSEAEMAASEGELPLDSDLVEPEEEEPAPPPPPPEPEELNLQIETRAELQGTAKIAPNDAERMLVKKGDIIVAEDPITGAFCAMKAHIDPELETGTVIMDEEVFAASGIGSDEALVRLFEEEGISLDKVTLAVSPLTGEDVFPVIMDLRKSRSALKDYLEQYLVFKGLTLRWSEKNVAIKIESTDPKLSIGDVAYFDFTKKRVLTIKPDGVVQFNAVLLIDISKSMTGRDMDVKNVRPALEGIRSAFEHEKLEEFLENFKEGTMVSRKVAAAFAGLLYLSEKVGRGFGETVSIITFADEAQILEVKGKPYINTASGSKGVMNKLAGLIIENVVNKAGVATNMGAAIEKAAEVRGKFPRSKRGNPTMIVMLTDGFDTSNQVKAMVEEKFAGETDIVLYTVGLGPFVKEEELQQISEICGGEAFQPEDLEELLAWYGQRARDLSIQLSER